MSRIRVLLTTLIVSFAALIYWLLATESGLRFVSARILPADGSVQITELHGSLWSGLVARGIRVSRPDVRIDVREALADLSLGPLWTGALHLASLRITGLRIERFETPNQKRSSPPASLPELRIEDLVIDTITFVQGQTRWQADRLTAQVAIEGSTIAIDALDLAAPQGRVEGVVVLDLLHDFPVRSARLSVDLRLDGQRIAGGLEARTEHGRTNLTLAIEAPVLAAVALSDVRDRGRWQARIELPQQRIGEMPVSASMRISTRDGELRVAGEGVLGAWQVAGLDGSGRIDQSALTIASMRVRFAAPDGEIMLLGRIPFSDSQLLALELRSDHFSFPADSGLPLAVSGSVAVSGTRQALMLVPDLRLERANWPSARVDGRIMRDELGWRAEPVRLVAAHGELAIEGPLPGALDARPLQLRLRQFDPALLVPSWPGGLDADLSWTARNAEAGLHGELRIERIEGHLRGRRVLGQGIVSLAAGVLDRVDASLSLGESVLRLHRDGADAALQFDLDAPDLGDLWPDWRGRVQASAVLGRDLAIEANLDAVSTPWFAVGHARIQGLAGEAAQASVAMQGAVQELSIAAQRLERITLHVDGTRAAHRIEFAAQSGPRRLELAAIGGLSPQRVWRGELVELNLRTPELDASLDSAPRLTWRQDRFVLARTCLAGATGSRICLQLDHDRRRTDIDLEAIAIDVGSWSKQWASSAPFAIVARVSGSAALSLVEGRVHSFDARFFGADGRLLVEDRPDLDLGWRDFVFDLNAEGDSGQWRASATLRPEGSVTSEGSLRHRDGDWHYEGAIHLEVHRFDVIEAFTSQFASPRGDLSGDMQFRGRVRERPEWSGAFAVTGFAAELPELGLDLRDGALAIAAVPSGMIVRGAISSGEGQLILNGHRSSEAGARWQFTLEGDQAMLMDTPSLRLVLSPALTLRQREGDWRLEGRVEVVEARIDAEALTPPQLASADVVVIDRDSMADADALDWEVDVLLSVGKRARLRGYGFNGRIHGDLRIRQQSGGNAYGQGQLQVTGRYAAFGQRLTIRRGRLLYANSPLDEPTLDIEAERKAGSAVAGVRVTGTARAPQTEIYARPALPESEALALLITGRNLRSVSGADRQRLSSAALALGTIGGDLLASNLGAEIGIIGDAARGTEAFTIGKYLTPKLFVGYGIGLARNGSVLIGRYLLRDDIELEIISGQRTRASLNYFIEK